MVLSSYFIALATSHNVYYVSFRMYVIMLRMLLE